MVEYTAKDFSDGALFRAAQKTCLPPTSETPVLFITTEYVIILI